MRITGFYIWSLAFLLSCSNGAVSDNLPCLPDADDSANALMQWLMDTENGYSKTKSLGDLVITSTLLPAKWKALSEGVEIQDGKNPYSDQVHLRVKLEVPGFQDEFVKYGAGDMGTYQDRVQYYSFFVHEDVDICQGEQCIDALGHSWERTYSVANSIVMEFHFDAEDVMAMEDFSLVYNDKIFNSGPVRFNYKPNNCLYE